MTGLWLALGSAVVENLKRFEARKQQARLSDMFSYVYRR